MLFSATTNTTVTNNTQDAGKIHLGGGFRLPAQTTDVGKIRLGGGFRLPVAG